MKPRHATTILLAIALAGCNAMGGVPKEALANAKEAAASCVRVESLTMGKAIVTTANDTKGGLVNGTITVNPETCAITITNNRTIQVPAK